MTDYNVTVYHQHPASRIETNGIGALSSTELLSLLLTGDVADSEQARRLLSRFGSLSRIYNATPEEIATATDYGAETARVIHAGLELGRRLVAEPTDSEENRVASINDAARVLLPMLCHQPREQVVVLLLSPHLRLTHRHVMTRGSAHTTEFAVNEIVSYVLRRDAHNFIVAHNHPGDDQPVPSEPDVKQTERLNEACRLLGLNLVDHILVANQDFYSFREMGRGGFYR